MPHADSSPRVQKKAGPRPRRVCLRQSDDALLTELRRAADKVKGLLTLEAANRHRRVNSITILKRFGGWRRAADETRLAEGKQQPYTRSIGDAVRYKVMRCDMFKYVRCGANPAANPKVILHVDHKLPFSHGGRTVPENLQTLCARCNRGKGTNVEK